MTRCPACAYHFGPRDGAPAELGDAFSQEVRCPECGLPIPAGSRVVVGSPSAYAVGAKPAWSKVWPLLVLGGIAAFFMLPDLVRSLFAWISGHGAPSAETALLAFVLVTAVVGGLVLARLRRAHAQRAASEEALAPHEAILVSRGWLFAPGALAVFDRASVRRSVEVIDARAVRSLRVRRCAEVGDGLASACEFSVRLLPPGPPACPPVHVRTELEPAVIAASLEASLRMPSDASQSLAERIAEWRSTEHAGELRVRVRGAAESTGAAAPPAIEFWDDGRTAVLRGSPAAVEPVPLEATVRSMWLMLLLPVVGLVGGGFFLGASAFSRSPVFALVPLFACAAALFAGVVLPWIQKRRTYAEEAEWRISAAGVEIVRGNTVTRVDPAAIRALEVVERFGVPQVVIRVTRTTDAFATLVPHSWCRLAPEVVLERLRAALRGG